MTTSELDVELANAASALETGRRFASGRFGLGLGMASPEEGPEYNDSAGQTLALSDVHRFLLAVGLRPYPTAHSPSRRAPRPNEILSNKQQVDARGNVIYPAGPDGTFLSPRLPDRAFIDPTAPGRNLRVNVEVDVTPGSFQASKAKLLGTGRPLDPNARHVFVQVDPNTGRMVRAEIYDPRRKQPRVVTDSLRASHLLARPKRDRTVVRAREAEDFESEQESGSFYYGCTPCVRGWKVCNQPIVPDDGKCRYVGWDTYYCQC
jgi:hypothetical protein